MSGEPENSYPAGNSLGGPRISPLERAHRRSAVELLARAFRDNPLNAAVIRGDPTQRLRSTRHGMRATLAASFGRCWVWSATQPDASGAPELAAVLVATPPYAYPLPRPPAAAQLRWLVAQGWRVARRWSQVHGQLAEVHPLEPHCYLAILGVGPNWQHRGIGRALLDAWLERVDADRAPSYLETDRVENVAFYTRAGFEVRGEVDALGAKVWCMWRAAR